MDWDPVDEKMGNNGCGVCFFVGAEWMRKDSAIFSLFINLLLDGFEFFEWWISNFGINFSYISTFSSLKKAPSTKILMHTRTQMPEAFDCLLMVTVCVRPKLSSWQLISSFLFLHCVVDQCPVVQKPTQNAMIMSCQMPITGNSASQCMVDETVTHCQPSSRSSLSFMSHLSNYIRLVLFFFKCECHEASDFNRCWPMLCTKYINAMMIDTTIQKHLITHEHKE